jgi:hypothetical protein
MADDPTETEPPRVFTSRVYSRHPDDAPNEERVRPAGRFWNPAAAWARYRDLKACDPSITRGVVIPDQVISRGDEGWRKNR